MTMIGIGRDNHQDLNQAKSPVATITKQEKNIGITIDQSEGETNIPRIETDGKAKQKAEITVRKLSDLFPGHQHHESRQAVQEVHTARQHPQVTN